MKKKTRRLAGRSGKQICPICDRQTLLVEHHIHGRKIPKWNSWWNVVWTCASCHDEIHVGVVVIEGWVSTTEGRELAWHKKGFASVYKEGAAPKLYSELETKARDERVMKSVPPCPDCGAKAILASRSSMSSSTNGSEMIWKCEDGCDVYVGCQPSATKPLGTMAGLKLRMLRQRAHGAFDWMWKGGKIKRTVAYRKLQREMGLTEEEAHIGMMDKDQCLRVIKVFGSKKPWKSPSF